MAMVAHGKIKRPNGLSRKQALEFAKTKHNGLPDTVKESDMSLMDYLVAGRKAKVKENENMGDYFPDAGDEFDDQAHQVTCEHCNGTGESSDGQSCPECEGEGSMYEGMHFDNAAPHLNRKNPGDSHKSKSKGAKRHGDSHVVSGTSNRAKVGNYLRNRGRADESFSFIEYLLNEDLLNELSNKKLLQYVDAADKDATKALKKGDSKKANKRLSGGIKASQRVHAGYPRGTKKKKS